MELPLLVMDNFTMQALRTAAPTSLVAALVLLYVVGTLSYGIYNVYFHPLSRFPGPKLWAAYRVPYVINNLRGQVPYKVRGFHRKYGPVVRIAPDELSFTNPQAWNDIYGLQDGRFQNQKDKYSYMPQMPGFERNILFAPDDDVHSRLRRIYGPAFTTAAVKEQEALLTKYSNLFITQLKLAIKKSSVQDISAWFNFAVFDILGDFAFGEEFNSLASGGQYHMLVTTTFEGLITGTRIMQLERYKIWSIVKPFLPASFMKPKIAMDNYVKELVDRRLKQGYMPGKMDVFNYLLTNKDDQLSLPELYENGFTLVAAGFETLSSFLSGLTYLLCIHPRVLAKVQHEVRMMFKETNDITPNSLNDLSYMIAVLSEALRLRPGTPFALPRLIRSKVGQMVAGVWVPEKTVCGVPHYAAFRDEHNFTKPDEFIPERWLLDTSLEFKPDTVEAFQPFHVGPRSCLGRNLAIAEMRLLLAKMLWHFDFELENPEEDWEGNLRAYLVWERTPLKVILTPVQ